MAEMPSLLGEELGILDVDCDAAAETGAGHAIFKLVHAVLLWVAGWVFGHFVSWYGVEGSEGVVDDEL